MVDAGMRSLIPIPTHPSPTLRLLHFSTIDYDLYLLTSIRD